MVMLAEAEYERLPAKADQEKPLLPDPFPNGNYPAMPCFAGFPGPRGMGGQLFG